MKTDYLIVSPCRDEAQYMRATLDSVVAQTALPKKWVIVDDGSTDRSCEILQQYAKDHDWIELVRRDNRGHRAVGPGVIDAFYAGLEQVNLDHYDYLCKLDMDLRLPTGYFESLLGQMHRNSRLGCCSGKAYINQNGILVSERHGDETSIGASKFYRIDCFLEIGGFVRNVMWDGIDCHQCRMRGWIACSIDQPPLRFEHLRPMGSSQNSILRGRMRHGYGQYFMGTGWTWIIASAIYRIPEKPYIVGGFFILVGYFVSWIKRKPRFDAPGFRQFLRRYQRRALLLGKRRAIEEIDRNYRPRFEHE